jgi:hypothetical protein
MGRFANRDPIGYQDGMNLYAGYFAQHFAVDPSGNRFIGKHSNGELSQEVNYYNPVIQTVENPTDADYYYSVKGRTRTSTWLPEYEEYGKGEKPCCKIDGEYILRALIYVSVNNPDYTTPNTPPVVGEGIPSVGRNYMLEQRPQPYYPSRPVPREQGFIDETRAHELAHWRQWKKLHDEWDPIFIQWAGKEGNSMTECAELKKDYEAIVKSYLGANDAVKNKNDKHSGIFRRFRKSHVSRDGTERFINHYGVNNE